MKKSSGAIVSPLKYVGLNILKPLMQSKGYLGYKADGDFKFIEFEEHLPIYVVIVFQWFVPLPDNFFKIKSKIICNDYSYFIFIKRHIRIV